MDQAPGWGPLRPVKELSIDCGCRKPKTGLGEKAQQDLDLDLKQCWVIGDKESDLKFAANLGCRSVLVKTGYGEKALANMRKKGQKPEFCAADIARAAELILGQEQA